MTAAAALPQALVPQWDAHPRVGALMSTRAGGVSVGPWDSLNLGLASGDEGAAVAHNRARFEQAIGATPVYLRQVHAAGVVRLRAGSAPSDSIQADAAWTDAPGVACTVLVADCLPVLMAAPAGNVVAAAHAGWRGLAGGVLEATLAAVTRVAQCASAEVDTWLGPCIGPQRFEVGADVLAAFGVAPERTEGSCFSLRVRADGSPYQHADGHPRWWADLAALARKRLRQAGVERLSGGSWCTVEDASRFFSFRRDRVTGRMAAAIWLRD